LLSRGFDASLLGVERLSRRQQTHKELRAIVDAIAVRNGKRAEKLVSDHLLRTLATINIWRWLEGKVRLGVKGARTQRLPMHANNPPDRASDSLPSAIHLRFILSLRRML
jgi:hypothetical protein